MDFEGNNICDWCGDACDEGAVAQLVCPRPTCGRFTYHQTCVEQWLRKSKLPPDRMAGFPCPRGNGKKTTLAEPCKGRIDSSHRRVIPRKAKKPTPVHVPPPKPLHAAKPKPQPQAQGSAGHSGSMTPAAGGHSMQLTAAQMKALAATIRKELSSRTVIEMVAEDAPARAPKQPKPAAPRVVVQPGQGAAARLGTAKQEQATYIPGMEPAERAPAQNRRRPRAAAAVPAPAPAPPLPTLHTLAEPHAKVKPTINALNGAGGFVTDLDRYNAILRSLGADDLDDDDIGDPGGAASPLSEVAPEFEVAPGVEEVQAGGDAAAAAGGGLDGLYLTDQQIIMGYLYGAEAAGLPADLAPLIQQLYSEYGFAPGAEGGFAPAALEPHTPDQQAEADRAAYDEAERVVAEAEVQQQAWEQEHQLMQAAGWPNPVQVLGPTLPTPVAYAPPPTALGVVPVPVHGAVATPVLPTFAPTAGLPLAKSVEPPAGAGMLEAEGADEGDVDEELFDDLLALCLAPAVK